MIGKRVVRPVPGYAGAARHGRVTALDGKLYRVQWADGSSGWYQDTELTTHDRIEGRAG